MISSPEPLVLEHRTSVIRQPAVVIDPAPVCCQGTQSTRNRPRQGGLKGTVSLSGGVRNAIGDPTSPYGNLFSPSP